MSERHKLLLAAVVLVAALVAAVRAPTLASSIQDDGFIYFRIAENAAAGKGPVFNPGERVDAATSPVWLWLLAGAAWLGIPLHFAAAALGLLATTLTVLACASWGLELSAVGDAERDGSRQRKPSAGAHGERRALGWIVGGLSVSGTLLLALDDRILLYAFSGMETALCALVWVWASRALVRGWILQRATRGAGWWALAAALTRPEFVLLVAGIGIAALLRPSSQRVPWRTLATTLAPAAIGGAAYLVAHTLYYGDPFPNTYYAKRASDWAHARIGVDYVMGFVRAYPWVLFALVAHASRALRPVALSIGAGLVLFTLHIVRLGGDHFEYQRMFIHVLPILAALAGGGAARVFKESHARADAGPPAQAQRGRRGWSYVVGAAMLGMLLVGSRSHVSRDAFQWVQLAARLGPALAEAYPPETRVGLFALGATGYTSGMPVIDALGIADKHVARRDLSHEHVCHLDIGHERGDPEYVLANADVVVMFAAYSPFEFGSLLEVRDGFYSHKKFLAVAREAVRRREFALRNIEFMPGVHWAVLERTR